MSRSYVMRPTSASRVPNDISGTCDARPLDSPGANGGGGAWARRIASPKRPCPMCDGLGFCEGILEAPLVCPCGCRAGRIVARAVKACGYEWPVRKGIAERLPPDVLARCESAIAFGQLARAFAAIGYAIKSRRTA